MPLDKAALKAGIKQLHEDMITRDQPSDEYADRMATLLENFVKSATVKSGIPVSTTGTAASHTGATTGTGTLE